MVVNAAINPFASPQNAPKSNVKRTATSVGNPDISIKYTQIHPLSATTLLTDRSMQPMISTNAIPNANTASTLHWRTTESRLSFVKNVFVKIDNATTRINSATNIIELRFRNFFTSRTKALLFDAIFVSPYRIMHYFLLSYLFFSRIHEFHKFSFTHDTYARTHIHDFR